MHPPQDPIRSKYLSKLGISPPLHVHRKNNKVKPTRRSRRVQFRDLVTIHEIPSIHDVSEAERNSLWYSPQEILQISMRNYLADNSCANYKELHPAAIAALSTAAYQRGSQLHLFPNNKQLAIRNACLRPPVRVDDGTMMWPQYIC